jgi:hypothetical protein
VILSGGETKRFQPAGHRGPEAEPRVVGKWHDPKMIRLQRFQQPVERKSAAAARRMRIALALAFIILATMIGCRSVWVHKNWSEAQYQADLGECANAINGKLCLQSRGWNTEPGWIWSPPTRQPRKWYEFWW